MITGGASKRQKLGLDPSLVPDRGNESHELKPQGSGESRRMGPPPRPEPRVGIFDTQTGGYIAVPVRYPTISREHIRDLYLCCGKKLEELPHKVNDAYIDENNLQEITEGKRLGMFYVKEPRFVNGVEVDSFDRQVIPIWSYVKDKDYKKNGIYNLNISVSPELGSIHKNSRNTS